MRQDVAVDQTCRTDEGEGQEEKHGGEEVDRKHRMDEGEGAEAKMGEVVVNHRS